jgi:hypothetical protein
MSGTTNQELLRAQTTTALIGTPGAGLKGPDQFLAHLRLARESVESLDRLFRAGSIYVTTAQSGSIRRISLGTGNIRAAAEGTDPAFTANATHSGVAFATNRHRIDLEITAQSETYAANAAGGGEDWSTATMNEASEAWGLDILRLGMVGDVLSADPSLNIDDGWLVQIQAGGNRFDGSTINGGNFTWGHLAGARQLLPERHKSRMKSMEWWLSGTKFEEFLEEVADRATSGGDKIISEGADGVTKFYGRPVNILDALGTTVLLAEPKNLILVANKNTWNLKAESNGVYAVREVTHLFGTLEMDAVIADVTGIVEIHTLN